MVFNIRASRRDVGSAEGWLRRPFSCVTRPSNAACSCSRFGERSIAFSAAFAYVVACSDESSSLSESHSPTTKFAPAWLGLPALYVLRMSGCLDFGRTVDVVKREIDAAPFGKGDKPLRQLGAQRLAGFEVPDVALCAADPIGQHLLRHAEAFADGFEVVHGQIIISAACH